MSIGPIQVEEKTLQRFWRKVDKNTESGCWLWIGGKSRGGYGSFGLPKGGNMPKRPVLAHRFVWEVTFCQIPPGLKVCHSCDNPACVNPKHLLLGSQLANLRDARQKLRLKPFGPGILHSGHKLSESDVAFIREQDDGLDVDRLATRFGVTTGAIRCVRRRSTWRHLP